MRQKDRISAYLDTIMEKSMSGESQSMIFAVDAAQIAGNNAGALCKNYLAGSCNGSNNSCKNYGVCISDGNNGVCENLPSENPCTFNSASCTITVNNVASSCGKP